MLRIELKKAFRNKFFIAAVIIACVLSVTIGVLAVDKYLKHFERIEMNNEKLNRIENPWLPVASLYNYWIADLNLIELPYLYYFLWPLLSAFAYSWSYCSELESGYVKNILQRTARINFFLSKYIAVFLSGASVTFTSLFANIALVSSFVPAIKPDLFYAEQYIHRSGTMFAYLFYAYPTLYLIAMVILTTIFGGIFACISLAFTYYFKNRVAGVIIPFVAIILLNYSSAIFASELNYIEISPLKFLHSTTGCIHFLWVAVVQVIGLIAITVFMAVRRSKKSDIF